MYFWVYTSANIQKKSGKKRCKIKKKLNKV